MSGVDPTSFEFAVRKIDDGFIFERFIQEYLSQVLGYDFVPAGGIKDRGIDGLDHIFCGQKYERNIYQMSIEKSYESKLARTLKTLTENNIQFDQLYFVTNQTFFDQDQAIDKLFATYQKPIHIYDIRWLSNRVNQSSATVTVFNRFVSNYLQEFNQPGKSFEIGDFIHDPRLYVFLRQQWDEKRNDLALDDILADTLILYSLEGTDPDLGIFKTRQQIKEEARNYIHFDPKTLYETIDSRLDVLSTKPRKIKYHSQHKAYCLPYETRLEIQNRNIQDLAMYQEFTNGMDVILQGHLNGLNVSISDGKALIEAILRQIFYNQGLEFANFVLHGENADAIEKDLGEVIRHIVDESHIPPKNKEKIKTALHWSIRDLVYKGNLSQKIFLQRLSNTYMMLFLLQCDPKLSTYFNSLTSKLRVYVCTSIIIPALSEYHLDPINRRHWNLLKGAYQAGVSLVINENILEELVSHFRFIKNQYELEYQGREDIFLNDEMQMLYVNEIMIRAYFHAKMNGKVKDFDSFLDNFVTPNLSNAKDELVDWLKEEFGIHFKSNSSTGVKPNQEEARLLTERLAKSKKNIAKAKSDAQIVLTIYGIRDANNETDSSGIFGYRTWWLSKDTLTHTTVNSLFRDKYKVSCYMRPDFLYNYISLSPKKDEVDDTYSKLFPSLIGANIGFRLPREVVEFVHLKLKEHKEKSPARIKGILRTLTQQIISDPSYATRVHVSHYLDEQLNNLQNGE